MSEVYYRLVSDYGYGDKTWLERMLTLNQALDALSVHRPHHELKTHDDIVWMNTDSLYYLEEDHDEDVEDWDWMDS